MCGSKKRAALLRIAGIAILRQVKNHLIKRNQRMEASRSNPSKQCFVFFGEKAFVFLSKCASHMPKYRVEI